MQLRILVSILFILLIANTNANADPIDQYAPAAIWNEITVTGVYTPLEKSTTTVIITGNIKLLAFDRTAEITGINVIADAQYHKQITIVDGNNNFQLSFEYPQLEPNTYLDFITLSSDSEDIFILSDSFDLVVVKDTLDIELDNTEFEYNEIIKIKGNVSQSNYFLEDRFLISLFENDNNLVSSYLNNSTFEFTIVDTRKLDTYPMYLHSTENKYYQELNLEFEVNIISAYGEIIASDYDPSIDKINIKNDTVSFMLVDKHNAPLSNISVGLIIFDTIFLNQTDSNGSIDFDVGYQIYDTRDQGGGDIDIKVFANHQNYTFSNKTYIMQVNKYEDLSPSIIDRIKDINRDFLTTMGILGSFMIASSSYNKKKRDQQNKKSVKK